MRRSGRREWHFGQKKHGGRRERTQNSRNPNYLRNPNSPQDARGNLRGNPRRPAVVDLRAIARKAMRNYGFEPFFPPSVMAQVDEIELEEDILQKAGSGARDLRHLLWSSIDNFDTEDLDQLEYCEQGKNGEILAKVAVADVDAFVPKHSITDLHARKSTTSVYTGIETYPMLPDRLSKNLSSLLPNQDRLAIVIEFTVLPHGQVKPGEIYRAMVRNRAKLVYEEVGAWLDGTNPAPKLIAENRALEAQVRLQNRAAMLLEKYRLQQGALGLESLEARAIIEHEKVLALALIEENPARHIIENLMIGANGTMSGFLEKRNIPTIQRVVREPKDWGEIVSLARAKGAILPKYPSAKALSIFLARQRKLDPERFPDLSLAVVKLIGNGEYVMYDKRNPIGHFCLAVTSYTHSTAPNRRYVDLIIQRLVKAALRGDKTPYAKRELEQAAAACTEREHAAKKVERFMVKAEAAALLIGKIGQVFDALITGVTDKGIYARLLDPPVEGKVVRWMRGMRVGQKVKVRLVNLDPPNGFIDLEIVR